MRSLFLWKQVFSFNRMNDRMHDLTWQRDKGLLSASMSFFLFPFVLFFHFFFNFYFYFYFFNYVLGNFWHNLSITDCFLIKCERLCIKCVYINKINILTNMGFYSAWDDIWTNLLSKNINFLCKKLNTNRLKNYWFPS